MIGLNPVLSQSASFWNIHLFGNTARYQHRGALQETGFYFRDEERLSPIINTLRRSDDDVIGVAEVWDDDMRVEIQASLKSEYPYAFASPAAPGIRKSIEDFAEQFPRLAGVLFGSCGGVVNYFTKSHYTDGKPGLLSEIGSYLSEDLLVRGLAQWLRSGPVWGAGLLFLSRHPIVSAVFHAHDTRADWEMLAAKGVIDATVKGENGVHWTYSLGHYQEGVSPRAERARGSQIRKARGRTLGVSGLLVNMADFNIKAGSREHRVMKRILRLNEVATADTYFEPNPYQDKLQAPPAEDVHGQRIDYFYHGDDVMVHSAEVFWDKFPSRDGLIGQSDHARLRARFFHRPEAAALAFEPAAALV